MVLTVDVRPARIRQSTATMSFTSFSQHVCHFCSFVSFSCFTALVAPIFSPRTPHAQSETHRAVLWTLLRDRHSRIRTRNGRSNVAHGVTLFRATDTYIHTHTGARERRVTEDTTYTDLTMTIQCAQNKYSRANITCTRMYWSRDDHAKSSIGMTHANVTHVREKWWSFTGNPFSCDARHRISNNRRSSCEKERSLVEEERSASTRHETSRYNLHARLTAVN